MQRFERLRLAHLFVLVLGLTVGIPAPADAYSGHGNAVRKLAVLPSYSIFGYNMNPYEVAACAAAGPTNCALAASSASAALADTGDWFPTLHIDGQRGNAFQHATWNSRMAVLIGRGLAESFSTAHEQPISSSNPPGPNQEARKERMDLCNNERGWNEPTTMEIIFKDQVSSVVRLRTEARGLSESGLSISGMRSGDSCDGSSLVIVLRDDTAWIS